jgi:hypothetical protein
MTMKTIHSFLLLALAAGLVLSPEHCIAQSSNEALGTGALQSNSTGSYNVALGDYSLFSNTGGSGNTATGFQALLSNTTGNANTATGYQALLSSTGVYNTASGFQALYSSTTGQTNVADGAYGLRARRGARRGCRGWSSSFHKPPLRAALLVCRQKVTQIGLSAVAGIATVWLSFSCRQIRFHCRSSFPFLTKRKAATCC